MTQQKVVLNGFSHDIFAGIPVSNFQASLDWYSKLFGCPPSFFPNDREAVWQLAEHQWMYIIVDAERAGNSIQNVMGQQLDKMLDEIAGRGINVSKEELPADNTRKVLYYDPDGNEIGFIQVSEE